MAIGPGKYDDVCTQVRLIAGATTAIVIIIDGNNGNGFAVQSIDPFIQTSLPKILREMAEQIENSK